MDLLERETEKFLKHLNLGRIDYEPCGFSTFPDFSISGNIAVECTRLVTKMGDRQLESDQIGLQDSLQNMLAKVRRGKISGNYFVSLHYSFPDDKYQFLREVREYLTDCAATGNIPTGTREISKNIAIDFVRKSDSQYPFSLGGVLCEELSGWKLPELATQCQEALLRKERKIRSSGSSFSEYWLAVGSSLSMGLRQDEIEWLTEQIQVSKPWTRLLLIDANSAVNSKVIEFL